MRRVPPRRRPETSACTCGVATLRTGLPVLGVSVPTAHADAMSEAQAASAQAAESGERVEVVGQRTEYSTTYANPDGLTFKLVQSAVPVRAKLPDGSWVAPDATLERRSDGSIGPKAAVLGISLSDGGDGDLVTLTEDGASLSLGWPGNLPEPTLDGASALYADVLPDVDLRMTATAEGIRQVLVVKSAAAAANPGLEELDFSLRTAGLTVREGGGGLSAVDANGNTVFRAPAAQMWDSAGDAASSSASASPASASQASFSLASANGTAASEEDGSGESSADPADGPGEGDASVMLPVSADADSVTVVPDAGLLTGDDTVYPLYIDPDVSWGESERTLLSSDGDTFYNFSGGDDGKGVGYCGTYVTGGYAYYCGSGYKNRMYFEFSPRKLAGKQVLDATFRVTERFSMSCEPSWVDLVRTGNISSSTKWPGPTANWDLMVDRNASAGRGSACDPSQPDKAIEFNDNPDESNENLTSTVKKFAAGDISRLTLMLKAHDESDPNGWKRFDDDATLDVDFVGIPAKPTAIGLVTGDGTQCETDQSDPLIVSSPKPRLTATVIDEVRAWQVRPSDELVSKDARLMNSDGYAGAELVASWNPADASGTTLADSDSGYGRSLTLSGGASLDGEGIVLDGTDDTAIASGPLVDETGSFTATTAVQLDADALAAKSIGYTAQVIGQRSADGSAWGFWYELKDTDIDLETDKTIPVGQWHFGRLNTDGSFTGVTSDAAATLGSPVRLTGVYDAQSGTISLYLGLNQNGDDTAYTAVVGSGDFAVGKGFANSAWGHYLPGTVTDIRVWAGAMAGQDQIANTVGD